MPRISAGQAESIIFSIRAAESQTQPACYPFSSVDHYRSAARKVEELQGRGYEVSERLLQRLDQARQRVYNPRRMKNIQRFGERYTSGDVFLGNTRRRT